MAKSRSFSVYLLKQGFSYENALRTDNLQSATAQNLPNGAHMYISSNNRIQPWWKEYWGVQNDIRQEYKSAIIFIPINDRWFAITYGATFHNLNDNSFEHDFGLITALNILDPNKIKSADILRPENAHKRRMQIPVASSLDFFDFNKDDSIIKRLTGAVKDEYMELMKAVTGATCLRFTSKIQPGDISALCSQLLDIYSRDDYKTIFPDIHNISPIKDPSIIGDLDAKLLDDFNNNSINLVLSIPEIIDYNHTVKIKYSGAGRSSLEFDDIYIGGYRQYLEEKHIQNINIDELKKHRLSIKDENGQKLDTYVMYRCLLYDCVLDDKTYHLCDGEWYVIDTDYLNRIQSELDPYFVDNLEYLPACTHRLESEYNNGVAEVNHNVICLDTESISPDGATRVEPCDLITIHEDKINFAHIKTSTRSSMLSHLFNQGVNSVTLLRLKEEARTKLKELLHHQNEYVTAIDRQDFFVVYGIITTKDAANKSRNLPLFSQISLLRIIRELSVMKIGCSICFISDEVNRRNRLN